MRELIILINVGLILIIATCLAFILMYVKKIHESLCHINSNNHSFDEKQTFDKSELTSYELERLEREDEFNQRINRLKEELAVQSDIIRRGVPAEELHPLVHNLPHDSIETKYDLSNYEEVAE